MMQHNTAAQSKSGIENYNFFGSGQAYVWMPVLHHQGKNGVYTELRYNYEDLKTASVYLGKNFGKESKVSYSITPMVGWVFGNFNGGALAMNMDIEYKKIFISTQNQYTISKDDINNNFFFNWTELAILPKPWFYAGISTQQTKMHGAAFENEYGLLAGFVIKKITIPVYVFNPLNTNRNFIIGINAEW